MTICESLLQVREHTGPGYLPLVDYATRRVAVLNYSPELEPEVLCAMQRHNQTDEVFVLLRGRCILLVGVGHESVTSILAERLRLYQIYNVPKLKRVCHV